MWCQALFGKQPHASGYRGKGTEVSEQGFERFPVSLQCGFIQRHADDEGLIGVGDQASSHPTQLGCAACVGGAVGYEEAPEAFRRI